MWLWYKSKERDITSVSLSVGDMGKDVPVNLTSMKRIKRERGKGAE
jgi:hypothetical protein